ncbi:hypothetical protein EG329_007332 [Mollisiaceae sp. DMI_Dod_QoI]|nr:hypothetical protein EG329_007332 [Helotiales sp. DMI_Dod_QoI]
MKCFAWIESALQALTNDGKSSQGKDDYKEKPPQQTQEGNEVKSKQIEGSSPKVASLSTTVKAAAQKSHREPKVDIWNDSDSASEKINSEPVKRTTIILLSKENLPVRTGSKSSGKSSGTMANSKEPLHDASLAFEYNPAVVAYVSSGHVQNPRTLRRRNMSSTSTIFKNSPLAPITIIVTTPEEYIPSPPTTAETSQPQNPFNQIRAHRQSASLPSSRRSSLSSSSPNLLIPDTNRLKPPTEQQINASKLRKAHEFREIRKFLLNFMNAKGDQFPKKLRCRMMEMYCITEADLSPETVAKFNAEIRDEGVALEQLGISEMESTDADDLRILQMAFTSQISVVTPKKEQVVVDSIRPPRARKQSLIGRRAESRKEKSEDEGTLTWLGPLITTTPLAAPPLDSPPPKPFTEKHKLIHAASLPNLHRPQDRDVPPVPSIPAAYNNAFASVKRGRNNTLSTASAPTEAKLRIMDQQTRIRRGNIISGAFGSIRDAIASSKANKAAEKRKLMRDAIL